jgi:hypothetical protein
MNQVKAIINMLAVRRKVIVLFLTREKFIFGPALSVLA